MRGAVLAALLLAVLLSLPNVLALRSSAVDSNAQVAVVSTNSALIALTAGTGSGNAANTAYYQNGVLLLDFTRGRSAGTGYGFPPRATGAFDKFRYRGLFTVTNRSDDSLCVSVHVPGGGVTDLAGIYVRSTGEAGTGTQVAGSGGSKNACATWLSAGGTFEVDFWWEISSGSEGLHTFAVRVEGSR